MKYSLTALSTHRSGHAASASRQLRIVAEYQREALCSMTNFEQPWRCAIFAVSSSKSSPNCMLVQDYEQMFTRNREKLLVSGDRAQDVALDEAESEA